MDVRSSGRQRQQQGVSAPTSEYSSTRHRAIGSQQHTLRNSRMMHSDTHLSSSSRDDRGGSRNFVAHMNFYNGFPDDFDYTNLS